jgi:2-keto-4-pentenoate hydratase/2-oxohepta-3-ene-1,7-dioic acid hydratase in catechol pathway
MSEVASTGRSLGEINFIYSLANVHLAPPILNPSKIICVGQNYYHHCREQGVEPPKRPILFAKYPSSVIGFGETITWSPENSTQVDYEAELAVVIKRRGRNILAQDASQYIAGYTILNDVSARDAQFGDGQWVRGKSFDTFCPLGPALVTPDEVGDPHTLGIRCRLNGVSMQDSNTEQLIFKIPELIAYISQTSTLLPGDIITTGTPPGVGAFRKPPVFLKDGDVVEVEIDKLGQLRNPVRCIAPELMSSN